MNKPSFTLVVVAVAGCLLAAAPGDAFAKGKGRGKKNRVETVRLARPAGGGDADATGTITITRGRRGDDAVLHVRGLDKKARYDVVDATTGAALGTLRTDRRGRGSLDLVPAKGQGKRAAAAGETSAVVPDAVDVIDPETGEPVLTGDTTGDLQALFGWATLGNATESVSVTMGSDPFADSQFFAFTFTTMPDATAEGDRWDLGIHEVLLDTAAGDELPLGATSVLDLAGLDFQVRDADGDVVFKGSLPDVEAYSVEEPMPCPDRGEIGIPEGEWDWGHGWSDPTQDPDFDPSVLLPDMPFDMGTWADFGDPASMDAVAGFFAGGMGGMMGATDGGMMGRSFRTGRVAEGGTDGTAAEIQFTLWIESGGTFEKAADLVTPEWCDWGGGWDEPKDDPNGDWDWTDADWTDWSWDESWSGDWGMPWDWTWDASGDPAAMMRNGRR